MKKLFICLIALILLSGCSSVISDKSTTSLSKSYEEELRFKQEDLDFSYDESTVIVFDDKDVEIYEGGTYLLSGNLSDSSIIVNCPDEEVKLVLDNVDISCSTSACINIIEAKKVTLTTTKGSVNTLVDSKHDDIDVDGCIYSKADLVINGEGTLNVYGNHKHGIVSKDDLIITSGTINVEAVKRGISGKDCVKIADGNINIKTNGDGIRSDNDEDEGRGYIYIAGGNITIDCEDKGITAYNNLYIDDGNITINNSYEGLEASYITINGGDLDISANDDGMNASNKTESANVSIFGNNTNADITINGGKVYICADGDGVDSNGTITINGGYTFIDGPSASADSAFDYETYGYAYAGELLAIGSSGMAENVSDGSSNVSILYNTSTRYPVGTTIVIYDGSGNKVFDEVSAKNFDSILVMSESFKVGDTITIELNGEKFEQTLDDVINGTGSGIGGIPQGGFNPGGNFDPNNMSEDFDKDNMPTVPDNDKAQKDFNPDDLPEDFDPSNMPGGQRPNGQMPNNTQIPKQ